VYHLGDNIFTEGIMRPFNHFVKTKPDALLTMVEHEENFRLGVPFFDAEGKLEKVVEKPENPPNKFGVPGLYFFNSNVFKAFDGEGKVVPSARGEYEITDLYTYLLHHNYTVEVEEVDGRWMDPGKFGDMIEANTYILSLMKSATISGQVDGQSQLEGLVAVGAGSSIQNSKIVGPTAIGENVMIENCYIGPNVAIDNNCNLRGVTIRNSVIMEETAMTDISMPIVDSLIGKKTQVWEEKQQAVSLFIGDYCKIRLT
jgi:glucose-1-phosphate thymidylyltransferase